MKSFKEQFVECRRDGYHQKGDVVHKPNKAVKAGKDNKKDKSEQEEKPKKKRELFFIKCLRFGGICDSANKKCRKMRGVD